MRNSKIYLAGLGAALLGCQSSATTSSTPSVEEDGEPAPTSMVLVQTDQEIRSPRRDARLAFAANQGAFRGGYVNHDARVAKTGLVEVTAKRGTQTSRGI